VTAQKNARIAEQRTGKENQTNRHGIDSLPVAQPKRLPAYGGALLALRRTGRTVPYLAISISWNFGKGVPRVVIPDDMDLCDLDMHFVRGLDCMVVHHGESVRAFDVAELALASGATICPVFDMAVGKLEATTGEVILSRGAAA
jgi:hypothetical protein